MAITVVLFGLHVQGPHLPILYTHITLFISGACAIILGTYSYAMRKASMFALVANALYMIAGIVLLVYDVAKIIMGR